ncbi:hypothetical protein ACFWXK_14105 [Streptomyces sp. NPDC059070]|uniref:hypothetical protein n=1 Tax=Streptomyces sp. NPDC059070 TaxID=3346713 RepID=UPI003697B4A9
MGYDIYIQGPDGRPAPGDDHYFCINYFDMPRLLDVMDSFGMLVELPFPSWPELSAYGLEKTHLQQEAEADAATANRIAEYRAAHQAVADACEAQPVGIPRYKLAYNDGFLIPPAEITAALTAYEAHPHAAVAELPLGDPTWGHWMTFLRRAKDLGGLRTH